MVLLSKQARRGGEEPGATFTRLPTPNVEGDLFISVKAVEWVLENSESTGNPRNILTVIAAHLNSDGYSWPSFDRLMKLSKCSRPTVGKCIAELEDSGELKVYREEGCANTYSLPRFMGAGPVKTSKDQLSSNAEPVNSSLPVPVNPALLKEEDNNRTLEEVETPSLMFPKPQKKQKTRTWPKKVFVREESVERKEYRDVPRQSAAERRREHNRKVFDEGEKLLVEHLRGHFERGSNKAV